MFIQLGQLVAVGLVLFIISQFANRANPVLLENILDEIKDIDKLDCTQDTNDANKK